MPRQFNNDDIWMEDNGPDILGAEEAEEHNPNEPLDLADTIARANPYADQLQHFATLKQAQAAAVAIQAPPVNTNPPSIMTSGIIGNQVSVITSFTTETRKQIVNWVGDDAHTSTIAVTLAATYPTGFNMGVIPATARPYAIVQFGTTGYLATAAIDFGLGCQFNVSGSSVNITAVMPVSITNPSDYNPPVQLAATLSFDTISRSLPITRTIYLAGVSEYAFIPSFAADFMVYKKISNATDITVSLYDTANIVIGQYDIAAGTAQTTPIRLPSGAYTISISGAAGVSNPVAISFGLAL
jgi:hypothetical protein